MKKLLIQVIIFPNIDALPDNGREIFKNMSFKRTEFLSTFGQMFTMNESAHNMLKEDKYWKLSFPHEKSGPCYTYDPPSESEAGLEVGIYVTMKSDRWDPDLLIYLHEEGKFYYTESQDPTTGKMQAILKPEILEEPPTLNHPTALGKI